MSLLDLASLVLAPTATKEGKVYSAIPDTGDGDLSFTRSNDTATRVNSAGLIEKVRGNLLLQSNTFDTTWTTTNTSVTGGQSGYDGSSDAWLLTRTNTSGYLWQSVTLSGVQTFSFRLKKGTLDWVVILTNNTSNNGTYFNLNTGAKGTDGSNVIDSSITSLGGDWYQCSVTLNVSTTAVYVYPAAGDLDVSGTSGNIYIQDAQLETGDIATDYIPTTSAAVSVGMLANVPRLDYTGGGCPKLLLEPQRTNVCLWSEQINNAGWGLTNSPTITTNIATAPDGYEGADGIQDTTGGTFKRIRQSTSVSANSTNTASVFVKKETIQTNFGGLALTYTGGTAKFAYAIINPVDGTIVVSSDSVIGATSTKAEDYGNWWRFSLTATDNGGNTNLEIAYYATLSTNGTSTGVGAGSVRTIWGFQLEIGATYATSYIPTLAAAVTRGAEQYDKVITSLVPDATTFTWEVDFIVPEFASGGGEIFGRNAAGTTQLRLYANNNGIIRFRVESGGQNYDTAVSVGDTAKCIFRCSSGVVSAFYNGVKIHTFTGVTMDFGKIQFGTPVTSPKIIRSLVFPTALTDAQCIELTTL